MEAEAWRLWPPHCVAWGVLQSADRARPHHHAGMRVLVCVWLTAPLAKPSQAVYKLEYKARLAAGKAGDDAGEAPRSGKRTWRG